MTLVHSKSSDQNSLTFFFYLFGLFVCVLWFCRTVVDCSGPLLCEFVSSAVMCNLCVEEVHKKGQGQREGEKKGEGEEQRRL